MGCLKAKAESEKRKVRAGLATVQKPESRDLRPERCGPERQNASNIFLHEKFSSYSGPGVAGSRLKMSETLNVFPLVRSTFALTLRLLVADDGNAARSSSNSTGLRRRMS
jgi:hypothetical protein